MRKTINITIGPEGKRDSGKVFVLTEMPARKAEKWAIKIFLALAHAGIMIPENIVEMGIAGIAVMGIRALQGLKYEDAEPIIDEMNEYIQIIPDPKRPDVVRTLVEDDIEEISTMLKLRKEIFKLNIDFFDSAAALT